PSREHQAGGLVHQRVRLDQSELHSFFIRQFSFVAFVPFVVSLLSLVACHFCSESKRRGTAHERHPDGSIRYGFFGTAPGWKRSDRSLALAASRTYGPMWKMFCNVRRSEE